MRLQDVFNLLPNLGVEALSRSFTVQSNDMMLAIYLASLTRSVLALHSLIDNKVRTSHTVHCWLLGLPSPGCRNSARPAMHVFTQPRIHPQRNPDLLGVLALQEQQVWKEKEAFGASKKAAKAVTSQNAAAGDTNGAGNADGKDAQND